MQRLIDRQDQELNNLRFRVLRPEIENDLHGAALRGLDPAVDAAFDNLIKTTIKTLGKGTKSPLLYATLVSELVELQYQYDKILEGEGV